MKKKSSPKSVGPQFTLYIVHGWMFDLSHWQPALDVFKQLKIKYKIFKIPSLTTKDTKVYTVDDYVQWFDKKWAKEDQVVVLAHSNGGRIALNYCLKHPQKIRHLILLNSAGVRPTVWRRIYNRFFKILSKIFFPFRKIPFFKRTLYKFLRVSDYHKAHPHLKETLKNMWLADKNLNANFSKIKTPISILWGENDKLTPLHHGQVLKKKLPNVVSFQVMPDIKHSPYRFKAQARILGNHILKILNDL